MVPSLKSRTTKAGRLAADKEEVQIEYEGLWMITAEYKEKQRKRIAVMARKVKLMIAQCNSKN